MELCAAKLNFLRKFVFDFFLFSKWRKEVKNGSKLGHLEFIEKFGY